ncbi:hypothetical protein EM868_09300 [Cupriavidus gilardii]|uniref:HeH/LEM domain-containing protein n=1 Tax=Cupriavidus gilardii TaxID=82541 RepID=UPI001EE4ECD7|nr:HeH/LEM domain-containing protein [Cupriavidus gilardii]MCG5259747.1 HeH/LEM domain-containing protein [Cupriavidus gilardii]MDF9429993.1 hypothetical protein [Cupriavidus gilardii]
MALVKNVSPGVVSIRGTTIIPPLRTADIDLDIPGVDRLIKRGVLERVEEPEAAVDEPRTVAELKDWLTAHGIEVPEGAKKPDLEALYEQAKAA